MHLPNGTLLRGGTYKIVRFIANGGFGCTYEALHPLLGKRVAIKEFFPDTLCNRDPETSYVTVGTLKQKTLADKLKKKFINEAGAIAQLSHPGIVKVSDVFEENGTAYYVMDYIDGQSLNKIIAERGPLSEKEALHYIRQVCDALAFVHSKNRLHLDIKPGNIMIDNEGRAILIDFGASKQYDMELGEKSSTIVGKTPGFAPIEQMGNDVSGFKPATDIYALGATLYKCLTGKTPLESTQLANGEELDPLPSNVSESTKKAISAAMQVGSKKRPQSIEEFLSILDESNPKTQEKEETVYDTPVNKHNEVTVPPSDSAKNGPEINSDVPSQEEEEPTSSRTKVYLGVVAAFIIALLCWIAFGGRESTQTSSGEARIAMLVDSLDNSDEQQAKQNKEKYPSLQIISPTKVIAGEEFKVVYRMIDGQGADFKAKNIKGCTKLTGPKVTQLNDTVEYMYTYKVEKEGTYTIPSDTINVEGNLISSKTVQFTVKDLLSQTGTINGHGYVDLGLPSGLKWATCNVGASKPEDYGSYFEWGETRTKSVYNGSDSETYRKDTPWLKSHGYINGSGNLTLNHDAAHKKWGGSWRMPTNSEIWELVNNTIAKWTTRNGKYGQLVTSKKNGNSIFLPAAGRFNGVSPFSEGELGFYWSSTPDKDNDIGAYGLQSKSGNFYSNWESRGLGCSVRPVSK